MNSMMRWEASSALMRSATSCPLAVVTLASGCGAAVAAGAKAGAAAVAAAICVASSPLLARASTMSHPPMSSPRMYSCGYVGQSLNFLRQSLTSWSVRMSKWPKEGHAPGPTRASTVRLLNPH